MLCAVWMGRDISVCDTRAWSQYVRFSTGNPCAQVGVQTRRCGGHPPVRFQTTRRERGARQLENYHNETPCTTQYYGTPHSSGRVCLSAVNNDRRKAHWHTWEVARESHTYSSRSRQYFPSKSAHSDCTASLICAVSLSSSAPNVTPVDEKSREYVGARAAAAHGVAAREAAGRPRRRVRSSIAVTIAQIQTFSRNNIASRIEPLRYEIISQMGTCMVWILEAVTLKKVPHYARAHLTDNRVS